MPHRTNIGLILCQSARTKWRPCEQHGGDDLACSKVAKGLRERYYGIQIAPWKYATLLVIQSWPKPWGIFVPSGLIMSKVAILIDGGFFIHRLPRLTDWSILNDAVRADQEIGRLVRGHLAYINSTARVENPYYQRNGTRNLSSTVASSMMQIPIPRGGIWQSAGKQSITLKRIPRPFD